jgi:hypothetical protein
VIGNRIALGDGVHAAGDDADACSSSDREIEPREVTDPAGEALVGVDVILPVELAAPSTAVPPGTGPSSPVNRDHRVLLEGAFVGRLDSRQPWAAGPAATREEPMSDPQRRSRSVATALVGMAAAFVVLGAGAADAVPGTTSVKVEPERSSPPWLWPHGYSDQARDRDHR